MMTPTQLKIIALLADGEKSIMDIFRQLGVSYAHLLRESRNLEADGYVTVTKRKNRLYLNVKPVYANFSLAAKKVVES